MSNVQWAGPLLDRLIAPEFSSVTSVSPPDVPELPNQHGSFFLNNVFITEFTDKARPLIFAMLRHLTQATREYRTACGALAEFRNAKPQSNDAATLYLRALAHFEHSVIHCDLSVSLSHAAARCIEANTPERHFEFGKGSAAERLRDLYNALKHFDSTVVNGKLPDRATPVWIVSEGLRGMRGSKENEDPVVVTLRFEELAEILTELAGNAQFLAEDVFRLAHERRGANTT